MKEIKTQWQWKSRDLQYYLPKDMETRHLFYTVRMIWNHTVPEKYKLKPYKKYRFSDFYTEEYIREGLPIMLKELSTRSDLNHYYLSSINFMIKQSEVIWKNIQSIAHHNCQELLSAQDLLPYTKH